LNGGYGSIGQGDFAWRLRAFHFLLAHGGAAPFTLAPLARHFDPTDPLDPAAATEHADLIADLIVNASD
jgi:TetR/AcrR family transcriptional regulator